MQHGQVPVERRRPQVLVDRVEAGEQLVESLRADGHHRRQPDRGAHRVATTDPVPEAERVGRIDAEGGDLLQVRGDGHEMPRDGVRVAERLDEPRSCGARVGHRLERRERLRGDDEQGLGRVEVAGRLGEVRRVDVGDEAERELASRVVPQRLVRHRGAEVGAADADVDHGADRPAGVAEPRARANGIGEHAASGRAPRGHPARRHGRPRRSDVPRGIRSATWSAGLSSVTLIRSPRNIASIRSGNPRASASRTRSSTVSSRDPLLGVVEIDARRLRRQPLATRRIGREEIAKVQRRDRVSMALERLPLRQRTQGGHTAIFAAPPESAAGAAR